MSHPRQRAASPRGPAVALPLCVAALAAAIPSTAEAVPAPTTDAAAGAPVAAAAAVPDTARDRARVRRAPGRVLAGRPVTLRGELASGRRGRPVLLQRRTERGWRTVERTLTRRGGAFTAAWPARAVGRHVLRARPGGGRSAGRPGRPGRPRVVRVFRPAAFSWFGPGFYGSRTACGQTLAPGMLGVAHKGLPCGTRVTIAHGSRAVTVPVIDRGPFVGSREWDLTAATRARIAAPSTGTVWVSH